MSGYRVTHDLDEDPVLQAGHILDEPLEFENGEAVVDDEDDARDLARRHTHVEYAGPVREPVEEMDSEDSNEAASEDESGEAFDAEAFVDRTPMDDVVEDVEAGEADGYLDEVLAAEEDGRDRNGVTETIEARRDELEE